MFVMRPGRRTIWPDSGALAAVSSRDNEFTTVRREWAGCSKTAIYTASCTSLSGELCNKLTLPSQPSTPSSEQRTADSRQQTADSGQQTADSR